MGGLDTGEKPLQFKRPRLLRKDDSVAGFSSGNAANDSWLHDRAQRSMDANTARVYVMYTTDGELAGYYALSTHSVCRSAQVPGNLRRNTPDPIPCILLGQLAVDERYQGQSAGGRLLQDALLRSRSATSLVGAKALVVNAANERAVGFYRHFGFRHMDGELTLYVNL